MQYIDLEHWNRKAQFDFFRNMDHPQYSVCVELDVTGLRDYVKARGLSFHYAMNYLAAEATDHAENFRLRIRGEQVVLHDRIHPSFVDPMEGGLFKMVNAERGSSIGEFCKIARETSDRQTSFFSPDEKLRDDFIYTSSIPWFSFIGLTHAHTSAPEDSVPRMTWGKYVQRDGRYWMPFSVEVHHSLVDGVHIAQYLEALQAAIAACGDAE